MTDTRTALDRLFLARQPILDATEVLIGYELLFRDSAVNRAGDIESGIATADVVCKAFAELGLANALSGHKAFIIADAEFLQHDALEALPPESVVLEVDAKLAADPAVVARCTELCSRGYSFCVCNLTTLDDAIAPLLKQALFIKLKLNALDDATLKKLLALPPPEFQPLPIASHVETHADHQRALALGFRFFQGYYFAAPTLVEGRKLDPALRGLVRIINLLNHDAELNEIEAAFKGEAALTLKLLRLTNSAGVGLRVRIGSVRQAINIIGRRHIQRWLQLLLFSHHGGSDIERSPLMQLAALKGNFMERLARRCYPEQASLSEQAFLAGLMSLMPAALGVPMDEILEQLAIVPQLRQALLQRQGDLGLLLRLTDCYDNDDPDGVATVLLDLGNRIGRDLLNQCLAESIGWVQSLTVDME